MTDGLRIELSGIDRMQRDLETMARRALPYAARETVNGLAFAGRKIWQEEMGRSLTLRNQFTQRRALVERARGGTSLRAIEAVLGHTEAYMALLEDGKPERATRSYRPIPTEHAAGQAKGSLPGGRKRAVQRASVIRALGSLKASVGRAKGRQARNASAVRHAIRSGKRLALLDMGRRKGIYRVMGSKKKPQIRKLYDLTRRSTPMPRIPTLQRTIDATLPKGPEIAHAALLRQLQRAGIAGY